jgi:hypothetical protein
VLKQLAIIASVTLCSVMPTKAISSPRLDERMVAAVPIQSETAFLSNWSHDIYGIAKSLGRKLGIDSEIDDGTEMSFREYGVFFVLFGGIFGLIIYMSLSQMKQK